MSRGPFELTPDDFPDAPVSPEGSVLRPRGDEEHVLDSMQVFSSECVAPRYPYFMPDGRLRHRYCGTLSCPACMAWRASQRADQVIDASPTHALGLTQAGSSWGEVRDAMAALRRRLTRGLHHVFGWAYVVEVGEATSYAHVHVALKGDLPDIVELYDAADRAGFGAELSYEPISSVPAYARYMTKVPRAAAASPNGWSEAERYLQWNGGRLLHASHGFGAPTGI